MRLSDPQREISQHQARFRIAACGRRFGKSFLAINELAKFARHPNRKCLYVAPTYRMAKQIIWEDAKALLREKRWVKKINESELIITLVNGSQIMLRSADNPDSIRGIGVDFCVVDEAADIPDLENTWRAVIRPTLSDRNGHALIIGSPKGRNYFYDLYNTTGAEWRSWSFTTIDGGRVSAAEIESAKRDLDERTFAQEYLAQWVNYSGLIYYNLHDANLKTMPVPPGVILQIGMDFNVSPIVATLGFQHQHGIHIFDEIQIYGSDTYELVSEINRRYPHNRKIVYPDASGAQRRTSAGGVTDHIILKNAGYELKVGSINPSVKDRIAAVNSALKSSTGEIRLTIDPGCKKLLECLRKQTYKESTQVPDKEGGYDHMNDALGYLINSLYPLRRDSGGGHAPVRRISGAYR